MKINKNMVLVKGKDCTKDILRWEYRDGRIVITYRNGASFPYTHYNVEFLKDPVEIKPEDCYILKDKQPLSNVARIQDFKSYIRVIYRSGFSETFGAGEIKLVRSCLSDAHSNNRFEYLKQVAYAVSLKAEDGGNILGRHYSRIGFVREDSILASFLSGIAPASNGKQSRTSIYPFGFNASQKEAVDNALNNKLCIIEGPPGTGKTQTILNIIANAVMKGESVAVVSSNNSATTNVFDKLKSYSIDFIAASLGSSANKDAFIENQSLTMPSFESWIMDDNECRQIITKLDDMSRELDEMLKNKNKLSALTQELEAIHLEYQYFMQYYDETNERDIDFRAVRKMKASAALKLWAQCEHYVKEQKRITVWQKIINFFQFGIYNHDFYRNSLERITAICQKHYYEASQNELHEQISEIKNKLSAYSFDSKMIEYSELSMLIFKSYIGEKYSSSSKRKIYETDDLWRNAEQFISDYPVILSTTYSLRSSLSSKFVYDYVIIDEASQVNLATGALALSCAKKAVIVGDLKQLPNVVTEEDKKITDDIFKHFNLPEAYRYSNHSLLSCVTELFENVPQVMLKEHYRCHPKIIEFCNKKFYNNQLVILSSPKTDKPPLVVYKTVEGNHARDHINQRQIDVITNEVIPQQRLNINDESIGIISPYRNHTAALENAFKDTMVKAATVDKFQGQEKDTIILCTVDNEISDFTDNPNRLNVAVSRAVNQLIVVTDGNKPDKSNNMSDLIKYVQYNNFDIIQSETYSVFDYLYRSYNNKREELLKKQKRVSEYDSENLMYGLIRKVLATESFSKLDVVLHVPLKMIIRNPHHLNDEETAYAMNSLTHVDFLLFDKLSKQPVLVVEVDGYAFHNQITRQFERDKLKDEILRKYNIPIARFKTNESNEERRLAEILMRGQA